MDKSKAMKVMAESHRETVNELKKSIEGHVKVKQVLAKKLHAARKENERYRKVIEKTVLEIHEIDRMNKPIGNPILSNIVARNLYMRSELMKALEGDPYE